MAGIVAVEDIGKYEFYEKVGSALADRLQWNIEYGTTKELRISRYMISVHKEYKPSSKLDYEINSSAILTPNKYSVNWGETTYRWSVAPNNSITASKPGGVPFFQSSNNPCREILSEGTERSLALAVFYAVHKVIDIMCGEGMIRPLDPVVWLDETLLIESALTAMSKLPSIGS